MKFVQSWRNLSFRVLMFVHIQNKSVFHASINTLFTAQARHAMKFVHSHKLEFHATMDMNQTRSCMPC